MGTIEQEIHQKKFKNNSIKLDVNIMFTASFMALVKKRNLDRFGISWQQFNILRILRGVHPLSYSLKDLTDRMVDRTSNTSRLVDKLITKNLVIRDTSDNDRRRVNITISFKGLELVDSASTTLEQELEKSLQHLSEEELVTLNQLLDKVRG